MAKILSIEDDADLQQVFGAILFKEGHEMEYAWNGKEGYEKALKFDPDLVILDLMLPLINGVELLKKLKDNKATQDIPAIIVTAFGDEADMVKTAVEVLGAVNFLRKPVRIQELLQSIKQVLATSPRQALRLAPQKARELRKGCVRADPKSMTVWIDERLVGALPQKEFALLKCLIQSPGPASKAKLLRALGYDAGQNDALKQVIHRLRALLGPAEKQRIKTTPQGYELIA